MEYDEFFKAVTGIETPHGWQGDLAGKHKCGDGIIRIPTGFGKTLGVLSAWLWNRIHRKDESWPRRLVWCLPMRVLVEQTEKEVRDALLRLDCLWNDNSLSHDGKVGVHLLMGGADSGDWHLYPEECAVLIGTQDMLLSRAMNRGYGSARARWPMEFGLLNHDCLWVMDEVQLMDVGLATSAQMQAFRFDDAGAGRFERPCHTWWMSATLQKNWLEKSPDTVQLINSLPHAAELPANDRTGCLWNDVKKICRIQPVKDAKALAALVANEHLAADRKTSGPTLVVLNTVKSAVEVYETLVKDKPLKEKETDIRLVHSRFRPAERATWRDEFLNKESCAPGTNRIIITTQVVEAGVDISASLLITELAPWASLVQRFGRCARWGGEATVIIADLAAGLAQGAAERKAALPYNLEEIRASRQALTYFADVAPACLEAFEAQHTELLAGLYPYEPQHLLLRHELDELFDTTPDLSGADIDISRFIRSGDERDLQVFWADIADKSEPDSELRPMREALCSVPFFDARVWLCGSRTKPSLDKGKRAWVWDWLEGAWRKAEGRDFYPGQTILVAADCGGYDEMKGWDGKSKKPKPVRPVGIVPPQSLEKADSGQDDESQSEAAKWQTIAFHGHETGNLLKDMTKELSPEYAEVFGLAGRLHDMGKSHEIFQGLITGDDRPKRQDIAKAPEKAWLKKKTRGFRHELASVLALFAILMRHKPDHPALLGPWRGFLTAAGMKPDDFSPPDAAPTAIENEIIALDADKFNLLAYLVCSHHGKVRVAWHACAADQEASDGVARIRGIADGVSLPSLPLFTADGHLSSLPESRLDLSPSFAGLNNKTGQGWTERVLSLLAEHGPFRLAWFEAIMRAADQRASRDSVSPDILLEGGNEKHELERCDTALAGAAGGGKTCHTVAENTTERGPEHGVRAGACGSGDAGSGTHTPRNATRFVETSLGFLSYTDLAPHLARNVHGIENEIEAGVFDEDHLDDRLIETIHRRICANLTPQLTGWRRCNVRVGQHDPPDYFQVPVLMREYTRDLGVRFECGSQSIDELLLETLAFAEGRLLSIHPFADFNGRVTRVFLRLLLRRLDLPAVDLIPPPEGLETYIAALQAADSMNWQPLMSIWRERFEMEVTP